MTTAWQIETMNRPSLGDAVGRRIEGDLKWLGIAQRFAVRVKRLFLVTGKVDRDQAERLARELLVDPVVETGAVREHAGYAGRAEGVAAVFRKPGVMDPAEASIKRAAARLGVPLTSVRTGAAYL